jgi:taurine dioxygenase
VLDVHSLNPFGAALTGLQVDTLAPDEADAVRLLLAEHGVLAMPDQDVDDHQFLSFLRSLGPLTFTTGETPVPGFDELNVISNVGRSTPPRSTFHTDTSYVQRPPAYTALRAVQVPERGGATLFSDQYRAYESLPAELRDWLTGRTATHVVTGLDLDDEMETSASHPIFREHPISGRTALYMSTPARCTAISGLASPVASDTIDYLFEQSTRDDNLLRHRWSPGDVVVWDNRCVMHRADHDGVVGDRVMHRGMVLEPD